MSTIAIMQPYFFPYIGYLQLINSVDEFVIYDDVNFIKQGYINRNSILGNNKPQTFTLQLKGASSNSLINEIELGNNGNKILKTIKQNYSKAPFFKGVMPLIEDILSNRENNLAIYVGSSLKKISKHLRISTAFHYSSELDKNSDLKAQDKVINICKNLNASHYINAIGGQAIYSKNAFEKSKIKLNFIKTDLQPYQQFEQTFIPYLSIIDVMMFNDINTINQHLQSYELI